MKSMFLQLRLRRLALLTLAFLSFRATGHGQSHGLTFGSHETVMEKRTSLDVSPDDSICFSKGFQLSFDINFLPNRHTYFGYVLRIISNGDHNIDLIYDQKTHSFKVIDGEAFTSINFTMDSLRLYKEWNRMSMKFNLEAQTLAFEVNGQKTGNCSIPLTFRCFKFLWGANDFQKFKTRDIPSMQVKDIRIYENDALRFFWPLDETEGTAAFDSVGRREARVKNPNWLRPKYQRWDLLSSFSLNGYAGVAFDPKTDRLYLTGSDSLAVFGLNSDKGQLGWVPSRHT